jgi:hypothetical protein
MWSSRGKVSGAVSNLHSTIFNKVHSTVKGGIIHGLGLRSLKYCISNLHMKWVYSAWFDVGAVFVLEYRMTLKEQTWIANTKCKVY